MSYVIGIDIGTGSTKAVAIDSKGKILESSQESYPTLRPEPVYSEQEPAVIWEAFAKCISRIVTTLKSKPAAIALSSAMHSIIPVDKNCKPLMNMITWADNRSADIAERIKNSPDGERIYATSGCPIHAMTPLCKIIWISENDKDIFSNSVKFISIKEYIWYQLFGVYEIDHSIASATGLFDITTNQWSTLSLEAAGIQTHQLSEPVRTTHVRSDLVDGVAAKLHVEDKIPFIIGSSDGCMANLGSFAVSPGTAALTIGTSGAIRVASRKPTVNFKAMTFNYRLFDDLVISGGPINNGGATLKWYAESFLKIKLDKASDYDNLLKAIDNTKPGSDGLIFLPYLLGERAPIWNSEASGVFFGIRNYHNQTHFTRAVVEGVSLALYSIMRTMESSGLQIDKVHVSGGFVQSTDWLQIICDIFNKPIVLIFDEDASAIGAGYLAMKELKMIEDYQELEASSHKTFKPDPKHHNTYQVLADVYVRLYEKVKDEMRTLIDLSEPSL